MVASAIHWCAGAAEGGVHQQAHTDLEGWWRCGCGTSLCEVSVRKEDGVQVMDESYD